MTTGLKDELKEAMRELREAGKDAAAGKPATKPKRQPKPKRASPATPEPTTPAPKPRASTHKTPVVVLDDPDDQDIEEKSSKTDEKRIKTLQKQLVKLSKKAVRRLNALLDSENDRVKMQSALGAIRVAVSALTRDTLPAGVGAEINIFTSAQAAVTGSPGQGEVQGQGEGGHGPQQPGQAHQIKAIGRPIAIVK